MIPSSSINSLNSSCNKFARGQLKLKVVDYYIKEGGLHCCFSQGLTLTVNKKSTIIGKRAVTDMLQIDLRFLKNAIHFDQHLNLTFSMENVAVFPLII